MPCLRNVGSSARTSRHAAPSTSQDRRDRPTCLPSSSRRPPSLSRNGETPTEIAIRSSVSSPLTPASASASPAPANRESSSSSTSNPKSHARKREEGYIKRPSNAFILFRTSFVSNRHIPTSIESHSQNLSRIAGQVWRSLPASEKSVWIEKAREVKREHERMFPEYAYHPSDSFSLRGRRRVVKGRGEREVREARERCRALAEWVKSGKEGGELDGVVGEDEMEDDGSVVRPAPVERGKSKQTRRRKEKEKEKPAPTPTLAEGEKLTEPVSWPPRDPNKPVAHCVNEFDRPEPVLDRRTLEDMGWPVPSGKERITFTTMREERDVTRATKEDTPSSSIPPPLFNLPNTFIPPDYEDLSTPSFAPVPVLSTSASTGTSSQPVAPDERRHFTLPPMQLAPRSNMNTSAVPVPVLPTKVVRMRTREVFPGALRVPDRPRLSVLGRGASSGKSVDANVDADADPNRVSSTRVYESVLPSKLRTNGASSTLEVPPAPPKGSRSRDTSTSPNSIIPNEPEPGSRHDPNAPPPKWTLRQVDRFPSRQSCTGGRGVGVGVGGGNVVKRGPVRFGGHRRCDETDADVESEDSVVGSSGVASASE